MLSSITIWVHLLCMVGAFGGLLVAQLSLPAKNVSHHLSILKPVNLMLAIGLLAGIIAYFLKIKDAAASGEELAGTVHMVVGIKFLILLGVGACCGMANGLLKKEKWEAAGRLRWAAGGLLAIAAFLGVLL
jgi:hypothetical protein